ncbi:MAG: hypothetical protein RL020_1920, partial [Pseudomonadota bacterium]
MNSPDMIFNKTLMQQLRLVGERDARLPANQSDWEALLLQVSTALT